MFLIGSPSASVASQFKVKLSAVVFAELVALSITLLISGRGLTIAILFEQLADQDTVPSVGVMQACQVSPIVVSSLVTLSVD